MVDALGGLAQRDGTPIGFLMVARPPRRSEVYATVLHGLLEGVPPAVAFESVPEAMFPKAAAKVCFTCWPESEAMFSVGDRLPPRLSGRHRQPESPWDRAVRSGGAVGRCGRATWSPAGRSMRWMRKLPASVLVKVFPGLSSCLYGVSALPLWVSGRFGEWRACRSRKASVVSAKWCATSPRRRRESENVSTTVTGQRAPVPSLDWRTAWRSMRPYGHVRKKRAWRCSTSTSIASS